MGETLNRTLLVLISVTATASCMRQQDKAAVNRTSQVEDSLRALVTDAFLGMQEKDLERALRPMSTDVVYVGDGFVVTGRDSVAALTRQAFGEWKSVKADVKITSVTVLQPDVAVVTWESQVNARIANGTDVPFGGVTTAVFVNRDGKWQMVRQHQCSPMPVEMAELKLHTSAMETH